MRYAIYQSKSLVADIAAETARILAVSSVNNSNDGITGFLHCEQGAFLQYLEGPDIALATTLARIKKDPRHTDLQVIAEDSLTARLFPDWQMGVIGPGHPGLSDLLEIAPEGWRFLLDDPFDLVVYLSSEADAQREQKASA